MNDTDRPELLDSLRERWDSLSHNWAVAPTAAHQRFEEVCGYYATPGRHYHTLDHIRQVLETVDTLRSSAKHFQAVQLAAWLHDVIYDSKATDNEERSAAYAERLCHELSIPESPLVAALILKTKTHGAGEDADSQVLLDADLAILGSSSTAYNDYAQQIRLEYHWVSEPEFRKGRRRVLESFLARPRIYSLLSHLEEPARNNLAAEMVRLT